MWDPQVMNRTNTFQYKPRFCMGVFDIRGEGIIHDYYWLVKWLGKQKKGNTSQQQKWTLVLPPKIRILIKRNQQQKLD